MVRKAVVLMIPVLMGSAAAVHAQSDVVDFRSDRWVLKDAEITTHLDRTCLRGTAYLEDAEFDNGVIEVDISVSGARSYPGLVFRMESEQEYERFYIRPHRAGLYPDALQYTPVFNGVACWQLYHGEGFTAPATIPADRWIHLKMEIHGTQARVFLDGADRPALVIHDLKHDPAKGWIGLMGPKNSTACFSNFEYRITDDLEFEDPPEPAPPARMLTEWQVSRVYPASQVDRTAYPGFFQIFAAQWRPLAAEPSGLVNISRFARRPGSAPHCVLARTILHSNSIRDVRLSFGYSDDVTVFLNGKPVFSGTSGYRSRDRSFVGVVGLFDAVYLPLQKGLNEICLMVTESFGGWGFMCQINRSLEPPIKRHDLLTKVWETPAVFKVPESVLYDPEREILYVSSFDKVARSNDHTGFISKVTVDGEVAELKWITGLDGPCGMGICGDKLFVVEGILANLVEIDIESGQIVDRHAIPNSTFLNDVATDDEGNIYISNTSRKPGSHDIYKFKDGKWEVWKDGHDLHRSNGLFVYGDDLIVGNTGDGLLKRVSLDSGRTSVITSLGAGVIDGIRVDNEGNYLVSRWEGQTYLVSPSGEVTEILDTLDAGLNSADFEFVKERNLLVIPTFLGNKVTAYELARE